MQSFGSDGDGGPGRTGGRGHAADGAHHDGRGDQPEQLPAVQESVPKPDQPRRLPGPRHLLPHARLCKLPPGNNKYGSVQELRCTYKSVWFGEFWFGLVGMVCFSWFGLVGFRLGCLV